MIILLICVILCISVYLCGKQDKSASLVRELYVYYKDIVRVQESNNKIAELIEQYLHCTNSAEEIKILDSIDAWAKDNKKLYEELSIQSKE